jgi:DNA-binding PadR family transcriptional regulator
MTPQKTSGKIIVKKPIKIVKKTKPKIKKSKKSIPEKSIVKLETPFIEFKGLLSFLILHELSIKSLAGEDLAKKIGRRKGSTLTPGTIYPALKKLKTKRLVKFEKQGRRKVYSLTKKGIADLDLSYSMFSRYFYGLKNKIKRIKR